MTISATMTSAIEALKAQPLTLAIIVVNLMFLIFGTVILREIGSAIRTERTERASFEKEIIELCVQRQPTI